MVCSTQAGALACRGLTLKHTNLFIWKLSNIAELAFCECHSASVAMLCSTSFSPYCIFSLLFFPCLSSYSHSLPHSDSSLFHLTTLSSALFVFSVSCTVFDSLEYSLFLLYLKSSDMNDQWYSLKGSHIWLLISLDYVCLQVDREVFQCLFCNFWYSYNTDIWDIPKVCHIIYFLSL